MTSFYNQDYSRQLLAYGENGQSLLRKAKVLIVGINGIGEQIAKYLILGGVEVVTIFDPTIVTAFDFSDMVFVQQASLENGDPRDKAVLNGLQGLNERAKVTIADIDCHGSSDVQSMVPALLTFISNNASELTHVVLAGQDNSVRSSLGTLCHDLSLPITMAQSDGLMGRIFNDFGATFTILDKDGEAEYTPEQFISSITTVMDEQGSLKLEVTVEQTDHDESITMLFRPKCPVELRSTNSDLRKGEVISASEKTITIRVIPDEMVLDDKNDDYWQRFTGGELRRAKIVQDIHFHSYDQYQSLPLNDDTSRSLLSGMKQRHGKDGELRLQLLQWLYRAMDIIPCPGNQTRIEWDNLTEPWFNNQFLPWYDRIMALLQQWVTETVNSPSSHKKVDEQALMGQYYTHSMDILLPLLYYASDRIRLYPITQFFGSIAAQQVINCIMKKFEPIQQDFYFAFEELFPLPVDIDVHDVVTMTDLEQCNIRHRSMMLFLRSKSMFDTLQCERVLLPGAGAIGCEVAVALAMMGMCSKDGKLIIIDNDSIESSNLSRQCLFRTKDVHRSKAEVVKEVITSQIYPDMNVTALVRKLSAYDDLTSYLGNLNGNKEDGSDRSITKIIVAVDNEKARKDLGDISYVNNIFHVSPGTNAIKASCHTNLPGQTRPKKTSRKDGGDDTTTNKVDKFGGACSPKDFKYSFAHCVQSAMFLFSNAFKEQPNRDPEQWFAELFIDTMQRLQVKTIEDIQNGTMAKNKVLPIPLSELTSEQQDLHDQFVTLATRLSVAAAEGCLEFDKDHHDHFDFVYYTSCLYAQCFPHITVGDRTFCRRIVTSIHPAVATSTATISALSVIEVLKAIQGKTDKDAYVNYSIDLGKKDIGLSDSFPMKQVPNEWSHIKIDDSEATMQQLCDAFSAATQLYPSEISCKVEVASSMTGKVMRRTLCVLEGTESDEEREVIMQTKVHQRIKSLIDADNAIGDNEYRFWVGNDRYLWLHMQGMNMETYDFVENVPLVGIRLM